MGLLAAFAQMAPKSLWGISLKMSDHACAADRGAVGWEAYCAMAKRASETADGPISNPSLKASQSAPPKKPAKGTHDAAASR